MEKFKRVGNGGKILKLWYKNITKEFFARLRLSRPNKALRHVRVSKLTVIGPKENLILPHLLFVPQVPHAYHAYLSNVKTESWTPCTKMCWRAIWWPLRINHCKWAWEQEEMIFIWAASLLHTPAGKEAGVQLQGPQLLFSNCLPKPSSIFHSFTEKKKIIIIQV